MTPDEGELILELFEPAASSELADRLNLNELDLSNKMVDLAQRGLLFKGKTQYVAWNSAHQLNPRALFSSDDNTPPGLLELRRKDKRYEGRSLCRDKRPA